jgi:hypothetical protein
MPSAAYQSPRPDAPDLHRPLTTEELAELLRVKPQTIRAGLCRHGHYFGVRPAKAPNGRLLWPSNAVDVLLGNQAGAK